MARVLVSTACILAAALTLQALGQDPGVFRGGGDTVRVFVTVTDKNDRLVSTLAREVFEVRDNGRPQPLTIFDNTPQPVRLIVMLDVSGSMQGNLSLLRDACRALFDRLRPDDVARVGTFGREVAISPIFTRDTRTLVQALPVDIEPNAPTPLWRAVNAAMDAFGEVEGRRVILVLSDGKDMPQWAFGEKFIGQSDVVDRARREDVLIYGVGLRSRQAFGGRMPAPGSNLASLLAEDLPDPGLGRAAEETGGGYFELRPRDDLAATFSRVADELHSQYLLGFTPPARDGKTHKIEVRVDAKDLKPRARRSYLAPKDAK